MAESSSISTSRSKIVPVEFWIRERSRGDCNTYPVVVPVHGAITALLPVVLAVVERVLLIDKNCVNQENMDGYLIS
jgi:hypothetical protein